jgi:hypothetical protein
LKQVVTRVASSLENCGSHLTLTKVNTSWESTHRLMTAKRTRLGGWWYHRDCTSCRYQSLAVRSKTFNLTRMFSSRYMYPCVMGSGCNKLCAVSFFVCYIICDKYKEHWQFASPVLDGLEWIPFDLQGGCNMRATYLWNQLGVVFPAIILFPLHYLITDFQRGNDLFRNFRSFVWFRRVLIWGLQLFNVTVFPTEGKFNSHRAFAYRSLTSVPRNKLTSVFSTTLLKPGKINID